ncbi:hypothetical protein FRC05_004534, partial [Tulasnella sp. 425]
METDAPNPKESDRLDRDPETPSDLCQKSHILDLQYDIIYLVFTFGWEQRRDFPVVVSHVCRLWRQYALDTPGFWSSLKFRTAVPEIEKYRTWLERSRGSPFDLLIDWQPFQGASVKHAKAIMRLVFPHVQRMRSLQVHQVPLKIRRLIFDRLDGTQLPSLETLDVKRGWGFDEGPSSREGKFKPFKNGDAINLKSVFLQRIPHDYVTHRFKHLKSLSIADRNIFGSSNHDNAKTVQNILSLLPHLQYLRVNREYSQNSYLAGRRPIGHPPPLTHSSLEELSLNATQDDVNAVVCALVLPSLRRLSHHGEGDLAIDICCLPILAQPQPLYPLPNLTMLKITGPHWSQSIQIPNDPYWRNMECLARALTGVPKLRSLGLEYVDLKDSKHLACLARTCPRLERLTILRCRGLALRELRAVMQNRRDPKGLHSDSLEYVHVENDKSTIQMNYEEAKRDGLGEDAEFNIEPSEARHNRIVVFERSNSARG